MEPVHVPVMRDRITALLSPALDRPGTVYLDCTLGLGGHAAAILTACPNARLIGIDRDPHAIGIAKRRLAGFGDRVKIYQAIYHELPEVLAEAGIRRVDALCADLGLSSLQIDDRSRGFAYSVDAPLDMRMNPETGPSAADLVNTAAPADLVRILRRFGEERFAERIVRRIEKARAEAQIQTSAQLVALIDAAIPAAAKHGGHPAKRTFQALRIAVNEELESLAEFLPAALGALAPAGRMAVLAYHSGEDRLVKRAFAEASTDNVPPGVPQVPVSHRAKFRLLTRGAERPDSAESATNPRAQSARLRAIAAEPGEPR